MKKQKQDALTWKKNLGSKAIDNSIIINNEQQINIETKTILPAEPKK